MSELLQSIAEEYWIKKLRNVQPFTLFYDKQTGKNTPGQPLTYTWNLPKPTADKLASVTRGAPSSTYLVLLSVLQSLVTKYTGDTEVLIATSGFVAHETESTGEALVYFRSGIESSTQPRQLLQQNLAAMNEILKYPGLESTYMQERFGSASEQEALYQLGFVLEGYNTDSLLLDSIRLLWKGLQTETGCTLTIRYQSHEYTSEQIRQLADHYTLTLTRFLHHPDQPLSRWTLLSSEEQVALLAAEQQKQSLVSQATLVQLFEEQVALFPEKEALRFNGQSMTYNQLNTYANSLAQYIRVHHQVQPNEVIGIVLNRSEYTVIAVLAVLKAGAAFLPVDPSFPAKRKQYMLENAAVQLLLTDSAFLFEITDYFNGSLVALDIQLAELPVIRQNPEPGSSPDDLAYILYTSGSTGMPKAVEIRNRSIANYVLWANRCYFRQEQGHRFALFTPLTFDLTLTSLFSSLLRGDGLYIAEEKAVAELLQDLFSHQTDVRAIKMTPAHVNLLGELDLSVTPVQTVILGGEALSSKQVSILRKLNPAMRIFNEYGPTEATVGCMVKEIQTEADDITIGQAIDFASIFILNEHNQPLPTGVAGEIAVSGVGVAKGYWNQPVYTAERFVPLHLDGEEKDIRIYKTGDIGVRLPDGEFQYLGRKDNQVKIRAYRVELGEIENTLVSHPHIREAVVVDLKDKDQSTFLVAYYVSDESLDVQALRAYIGKQLPDYMIPAFFVRLPKFPLTHHGKIDRKALPAPQEVLTHSANFQAPTNALETTLAQIWADVLDVPQVGITDDFFVLGGDSIKAIRVCNRIGQELGEIVHITLLFEAPTVKALAESLAKYRQQTSTQITAEKLAEFKASIPSPGLFPANPQKNKPAAFILSSPRAGSTLLRAILAGHSQLFSPPELELMSFTTLAEREQALAGRYGFFLEGTIRALMQLKGYSVEEAFAEVKALAEAGVSVQDFYKRMQEWAGEKLLVDKSPNYAFDLPTLERIEQYFDSPKYLLLARHPYGMIHSFEEAKMDQIFRFNHSFALRELAELVWLTSYQNIQQHLAAVPDSRKHIVQYEKLLASPRAEIEAICQFLEIPFEEKMLQVYDFPENRMLDGIYPDSKMIGDVKFLQYQQIDPARAYRWQKTYTQDFLSPLTLQVAAPFGYQPIQEASAPSTIEPIPLADYYEVSHAQERIWMTAQLEENQISYNVASSRVLEGIDRAILEKAYEALLRRHESLRTIFSNHDGKPKQKILQPGTAFRMTYLDLRHEANRWERAKELSRKETRIPFDLSTGPLVRTQLVHLEDHTYLLLFTLHHIISDGWTMDVLFRDMTALYEAFATTGTNTLPPLRIQYKDYAAWERRQLAGPNLQTHRAYWLTQLAGPVPVLNMRTDFPRPAVMAYQGVSTLLHIDAQLRDQLKELSRRENTSLFMTLLAVLQTLLYRYSSQKDIIIGSPFAGRGHAELEDQVGVFINLLAYRTPIGDGDTFVRLLQNVKKTVLEAYEHHLYPFDQVVKDLKLQRSPSRSPLFDVIFSLQNLGLANSLTSDEVFALQQNDMQTENSKFDLTLIFTEYEQGLAGCIKYNRTLFSKETIEVFKERFRRVVQAVIADPAVELDDIQLSEEISQPANHEVQINKSFNITF